MHILAKAVESKKFAGVALLPASRWIPVATNAIGYQYGTAVSRVTLPANQDR
jgi:hypothetical protein